MANGTAKNRKTHGEKLDVVSNLSKSLLNTQSRHNTDPDKSKEAQDALNYLDKNGLTPTVLNAVGLTKKDIEPEHIDATTKRLRYAIWEQNDILSVCANANQDEIQKLYKKFCEIEKETDPDVQPPSLEEMNNMLLRYYRTAPFTLTVQCIPEEYEDEDMDEESEIYYDLTVRFPDWTEELFGEVLEYSGYSISHSEPVDSNEFEDDVRDYLVGELMNELIAMSHHCPESSFAYSVLDILLNRLDDGSDLPDVDWEFVEYTTTPVTQDELVEMMDVRAVLIGRLELLGRSRDAKRAKEDIEFARSLYQEFGLNGPLNK